LLTGGGAGGVASQTQKPPPPPAPPPPPPPQVTPKPPPPPATHLAFRAFRTPHRAPIAQGLRGGSWGGVLPRGQDPHPGRPFSLWRGVKTPSHAPSRRDVTCCMLPAPRRKQSAPGLLYTVGLSHTFLSYQGIVTGSHAGPPCRWGIRPQAIIIYDDSRLLRTTLPPYLLFSDVFSE
jgi:hypothetical protein